MDLVKWIPACLILIGAASVIWAVNQNTKADLSDLPVLLIAGIGGAVSVIVGIVWVLIKLAIN